MTLTKTKPRRPTIAHRQRTGHHHSRSHHYLKPYWPYIPILGILIAGFMVNDLLSTLHHGVLGYATDMSVSSLLADTNVQRSDNGKATLGLNSKLNQAAQTKANDMAKRDYWSHNTPDGKTPWTFITAAGYNYQAAGENLAYGFDTAADTVTGWMNSPEHRANILNAAYKEVGFGIANNANYQGDGPETIVVAMYASPVAPAAAAPVTHTATASPTTTAVTAPSTHIAATPSAPAPHTTTTKKPVSATTKGDTTNKIISEPSAQRVARVQLMADGLPWTVLVVSLIAAAALILLLLRHSIAWHKALVRGERFVLRHPAFDMSAAAVLVVGFFLMQSAGFIR